MTFEDVATAGFSIPAFVEALRARAWEAAPEVVVVDVCDSTQEVAKALAHDGAEDGTLVVTPRQSAGRGRAGRQWVQLQGALAFSVVLRPKAPVAKWVRLTSLAGLALVDAVASLGGTAQLKWPNDLIVTPSEIAPAPPSVRAPLGHCRKVAGLLVDGFSRGTTLESAILGVGLNAVAAPIPESLEGIAATLDAAGVVTTAEEMLAAFVVAFKPRLSALDDDAKMRAALRDLRRASFTLGRSVVDQEGHVGVAVDLDLDGALKIEDSAGKTRLVWAGDVHLA